VPNVFGAEQGVFEEKNDIFFAVFGHLPKKWTVHNRRKGAF